MPRTKKLYIVPNGRGDLLDQFIEQAENALLERDKLRRQIARLRKQIRQNSVVPVQAKPQYETESTIE
jgi:PhoPQ-activated pathogenicity-related protein